MTALTLSRVVREDAAKYTLNLENEFGKADLTFDVTVLGELKELLLTKDISHTFSTYLSIAHLLLILIAHHIFPDVPMPPRNLQLTDVGPTFIVLKWDKPEDNGGSEVKSYLVERREANRRTWQKVMYVM